MLFQTTPAHEELRAKIRAFAEEEIKPLAFLLDQNNEFPDEPVKKMAQLGWLGLPFPKEYGGAGGDGGAALGTLDDLWQDVQGYMHIIVSHEDLDEAEALMAQAKALSAQGSTEELYPVLAQLRHQFRLIAETQQLSPKNIF